MYVLLFNQQEHWPNLNVQQEHKINATVMKLYQVLEIMVIVDAKLKLEKDILVKNGQLNPLMFITQI